MAEARAKLVTSSHANASDLDNEIATTNTTKKRSLPSAGGILKKSKYSSSTPAVPLQSDISKPEDNKSIENNNVLGSLMADYGDSSDDDKDTNTKAASTSNTDDQKQSNEPIQPTTNNDMQQQMPKKKKKKKKKKKDKSQVEDTNRFSGVDKTEAAQLKSEDEGNDKPTEVSDEVWDEFNALLDDDEVVAKDSQPLKSEETTDNAIPVEGETSTNSETPKTKKKKKGSKKKKDIYDNDDMNTVEQASYEARLARLMLLKSKKTQHKNSTKTDDVNDEKLLSASNNEFYDGGLSFQQNEEDDDKSDAESIANDTANLKADEVEAKDADDTNTTATSNTVASSISAPSVSLAAILRGRRDQARQLSRGNDKIDTAIDNEEEDESWF